MAATTVKVTTQTNHLLDTLQAREQLRTGKRVTKNSLIAQLARRALDSEEDLILLRAPDTPMSDRTWRKLLRTIPFDWGVRTSEEDIDRILYGDSG